MIRQMSLSNNICIYSKDICTYESLFIVITQSVIRYFRSCDHELFAFVINYTDSVLIFNIFSEKSKCLFRYRATSF